MIWFMISVRNGTVIAGQQASVFLGPASVGAVCERKPSHVPPPPHEAQLQGFRILRAREWFYHKV